MNSVVPWESPAETKQTSAKINGKTAAMMACAGLTALGQTAQAGWIVTEPVPGSPLDTNGDTLNLDIDGDATNDFSMTFSNGYTGTTYGFSGKYGILNDTDASITGQNGGMLLAGGANRTPQQILDNYINGGILGTGVASTTLKDYYDCQDGFAGLICGLIDTDYGPYPFSDTAFSGTLGLQLGNDSFGYVTLTGALGYGGAVSVDRFGLWEDDAEPPAGVPEPGTLALLATGALGIAAMRRRRKAAN